MRFIGNKENLLENIYNTVISTGIDSGSFCDFFSGTANVGKFLKKKGFKIVSSDLLHFSYILQMAYIHNNEEPKFTKLLKVINKSDLKENEIPLNTVVDYLNNIKGVKGFIYKNYTEEGTKDDQFQRKYFIPENGMKIDAIRTTIEKWKNKKIISENEYFILLACLIETVPFYANISGVYAAFLKGYDPRAIKLIKLRPIELNIGKHEDNLVFNKNSMELLDNLNVDILYLDPPYNERQYAPNYHLLETISKYDNPGIKGKTGMRNYSNQKSDFCNKDKALKALDIIANKAKYKFLLLSYNSEGIMPQNEILNILKKYGNTKIVEVEYKRFKSNSKGESKHKKYIQEQIYLLSKFE